MKPAKTSQIIAKPPKTSQIPFPCDYQNIALIISPLGLADLIRILL